VFVIAEPAVAVTAVPVAVPVTALVPRDTPTELPATASPLSAIGLIGLLSLAAAIALRERSCKPGQ
jgi:hypothetical protein